MCCVVVKANRQRIVWVKDNGCNAVSGIAFVALRYAKLKMRAVFVLIDIRGRLATLRQLCCRRVNAALFGLSCALCAYPARFSKTPA